VPPGVVSFKTTQDIDCLGEREREREKERESLANVNEWPEWTLHYAVYTHQSLAREQGA